MMHLARKQGMRIVADAAEADAWLELARPDAGSYFGEVFAQRAALFDFALKPCASCEASLRARRAKWRPCALPGPAADRGRAPGREAR